MSHLWLHYRQPLIHLSMHLAMMLCVGQSEKTGEIGERNSHPGSRHSTKSENSEVEAGARGTLHISFLGHPHVSHKLPSLNANSFLLPSLLHCSQQMVTSCCQKPQFQEPLQMCLDSRTNKILTLKCVFESFGTFLEL